MTREFVGRVQSKRRPQVPIILASDASCSATIAAGSYIASTGHWGLFHQSWDTDLWTPGDINSVELMALRRGLSRLFSSRDVPSGRQIIAYTDNKRAATLARWWLRGIHTPIPKRLTDQTQIDQLMTMQRQFSSWGDRVQIHWSPRKSGNNLHDTADVLARLALQASKHFSGAHTTKSAQKIVASYLYQKAA